MIIIDSNEDLLENTLLSESEWDNFEQPTIQEEYFSDDEDTDWKK